MSALTDSIDDLERGPGNGRSIGQGTWNDRLLHRAGNDGWRDWLRHRGSLTARLQRLGPFAVGVLRQELAQATRDEALLLGLHPRQHVWVREVALSCAGRRVVFAHTVLPYRPRGRLTGWLARLGNRSLGAMLFAHAGFRRGTMHFKRLDARHALFLPALQALAAEADSAKHLWARRSEFFFGAQTVLVTEIFAPPLLNRRPADEFHRRLPSDA